MNLLVDAHLPRKLAQLLNKQGHNALHTLDLPSGNCTPDQYINKRSITEQCIVVTKDADFINSFWLQNQPWKLLLISTGNIRNNELLSLFSENMKNIENGFEEFKFIELTYKNLIFHT